MPGVNNTSSTRSTLNKRTAELPETAPKPASADVLLLEGSLFLDKYKLPIVAAVLLLVLALIGSEVYEMQREKKLHQASAELDNARTAADYRHVMENYPGTLPAANAALLLGRDQFNAKDYAGAAKTWQSFADKNPQSMLAPEALIGAGTALDALGKIDQARAMYQRAATSFPSNFAAPLARLDEAALLKAQRKPEEARRVYENVMASAPNTDAAQQAAEELRFLHVMPPGPGVALEPGASTPPPVVVPAPAASLAPAASVAPGTQAPAASVTPATAVPLQPKAPPAPPALVAPSPLPH
jgi:tetratricopeptide (TPR) repeat protein